MASVVPERISVTDEESRLQALRLLQRDGAVIITDVDPSQADRLPNLLWNPSELAVPRFNAAAVHTEHVPLQLHGAALAPHTDGYIWGDGFPDVVMLVCEQPAVSSGGANFLLDGTALLKQVQEKRPDLANVLLTEPVDHTERSDSGVAAGVESVVPVWRWREQNVDSSWYEAPRFCWRRMVSPKPYNMEEKSDEKQSLWTTDQPEVEQALVYLDHTIVKESAVADRFVLKKNEGLVVDNFRLLHARDGFETSSSADRKMWRVWVWTKACMDVPPEIRKLEGAPATVIAAGEALEVREQ